MPAAAPGATEDIDIFGDIDEDAILKKIAEKEEEANAAPDQAPPDPPDWKAMSDADRTYELMVACLDPDVIGLAIAEDPMVVAPDPEDWADVGGYRKSRIRAFWRSRRPSAATGASTATPGASSRPTRPATSSASRATRPGRACRPTRAGATCSSTFPTSRR